MVGLRTHCEPEPDSARGSEQPGRSAVAGYDDVLHGSESGPTFEPGGGEVVEGATRPAVEGSTQREGDRRAMAGTAVTSVRGAPAANLGRERGGQGIQV